MNTQAQNLFIESVAVIDSTVYNIFLSSYGNLNPPNLLTDYIKIFFCQVFNGVKF
jgi:hypothetical protein